MGSLAAAWNLAAWKMREGWLTTFGITPTGAETGYGYLELGETLAQSRTFRVSRFIEKPPLADATRCAADARHVWNAGMFIHRAARAGGIRTGTLRSRSLRRAQSGSRCASEPLRVIEVQCGENLAEDDVARSDHR